MAYTTIPSAWTTAGEPTKQELFGRIKSNEDDLDSRVSSLETSIGAFRPIQFYVSGKHWLFGAPQSLVCFERVNFDLTLTAGRVVLLDVGTAGSLEIDILYKRGANPFASIFSTKPILGFGSSQFAINTGVLSTTALLSGDILALTISQAMTNCTEFMAELDFSI